MEGYKHLHSVSKVVQGIVDEWSPVIKTRSTRIDKALGERVAVDIVSTEDVPPFNRSVVDGCATRYELVMTASSSSPVYLSMRRGEVILVNTGDEVSNSFDVVIPIEYCDVRGDVVAVFASFRPGYGIGLRGEDISKGEKIVKRGERLTHVHIGVLASLGISNIEVYMPLRVIVYSTGNELVEPWEEKSPRQVYNSTGHLVTSFLRENGFSVDYGGLVPDSPSKIFSLLEKSVEKYDIVVFTGGTSKGERDYTASSIKKYVESRGGKYWHGVRLQPGRPLLVGVLGEKLVLGLSGFPVAAWSELYVVFMKAFLAKIGAKWPPFPVIEAQLARRLPSRPGFVEIYRSLVHSTGAGPVVEPLRLTGSGVLSSLLRGNSVIVTDENISGYDKGDYVDVHLLDAHC